ncbi:MAG: hypothetical protein J0I07_17435, partial [Myxococcales bacterium]|nr:hypothetical protein [Myxococcales bacterium]
MARSATTPPSRSSPPSRPCNNAHSTSSRRSRRTQYADRYPSTIARNLRPIAFDQGANFGLEESVRCGPTVATAQCPRSLPLYLSAGGRIVTRLWPRFARENYDEELSVEGSSFILASSISGVHRTELEDAPAAWRALERAVRDRRERGVTELGPLLELARGDERCHIELPLSDRWLEPGGSRTTYFDFLDALRAFRARYEELRSAGFSRVGPAPFEMTDPPAGFEVVEEGGHVQWRTREGGWYGCEQRGSGYGYQLNERAVGTFFEVKPDAAVIRCHHRHGAVHYRFKGDELRDLLVWDEALNHIAWITDREQDTRVRFATLAGEVYAQYLFPFVPPGTGDVGVELMCETPESFTRFNHFRVPRQRVKVNAGQFLVTVDDRDGRRLGGPSAIELVRPTRARAGVRLEMPRIDTLVLTRTARGAAPSVETRTGTTADLADFARALCTTELDAGASLRTLPFTYRWPDGRTEVVHVPVDAWFEHGEEHEDCGSIEEALHRFVAHDAKLRILGATRESDPPLAATLTGERASSPLGFSPAIVSYLRRREDGSVDECVAVGNTLFGGLRSYDPEGGLLLTVTCCGGPPRGLSCLRFDDGGDIWELCTYDANGEARSEPSRYRFDEGGLSDEDGVLVAGYHVATSSLPPETRNLLPYALTVYDSGQM